MRAATETRLLEVDPGSTGSVVVDVVNTGAVIDGVTANVIGLADECVQTQPSLLPLFPASSGQLTVSLAIPPTHPAGRHPITVELVSHGAHLPSQYLDIDLDVSARPGMAMTPVPRIVRARRSGRFVLEVANNGNVPLNVELKAVDVERSIKATFTPTQLRVEPGAVTPVLLHIRGPRMVTGGEADRAVQVSATAQRADLGADTEAADDAAPPLKPLTSNVQLRQRPLISRGMFTALILMSIVALWAAVFLFGLTKVFSNDPMTKAAPASFYMSAKSAQAANASGGSGAQAAAAGTSSAPATPPGALLKTGQLPAGIGGEITGTVRAASDEQPVSQILVEAYRQGRDGLKLVSSAATQSDGTYTLAGLFPTSYYLSFSSKPGFKTVWYPNVPTRQGAKLVDTTAQGSTTGINAVITGLPASISGSVDPGDTTKQVTTVVTARPLNTVGGSASTKKVTISGTKYAISGLQAPATYQLTFTTPGYQPTSIVDTVNGGDTRLEPVAILGAAQGGISGIVVNGKTANAQPIGGATVSTTVNGKTLSVLTPTTGAIGTFALGNLPTPATYVLTYSAPGHGSWTQVIALDAGQNKTTGLGQLSSGSGTVSGRVTEAGTKKKGLGGVTVTVGGATLGGSATPGSTPAATTPTTTTLTSPPSTGDFFLNGLADGTYTLTFTLDGYSSASVTVQIDSTKRYPVRVTLSKQAGEIDGAVTQGSIGWPGATITATDGLTTYTAVSSAAGGDLPAGGYRISGLKPGTYTVTASMIGFSQQTRIVVVAPGAIVAGQDFGLGG